MANLFAYLWLLPGIVVTAVLLHERRQISKFRRWKQIQATMIDAQVRAVTHDKWTGYFVEVELEYEVDRRTYARVLSYTGDSDPREHGGHLDVYHDPDRPTRIVPRGHKEWDLIESCIHSPEKVQRPIVLVAGLVLGVALLAGGAYIIRLM